MLTSLSPPKECRPAAPDAMCPASAAATRENGAREALWTSITAPRSVAWNVSYRCNLNCSHCAMDPAGRGDVRHELTTDEGRAMIEDLAAMRVAVLIFSGGEPLMREDMLELASFAAGKGLQPALSTNGTLIDRGTAGRMRDAGIEYAGVSLDGLEATHNLFRRNSRAFQGAVEGIGNCNEMGVKTGIRFTLNARNYHDLSGVLDLVEKLKVSRFCMCPRVPSGREDARRSRESEDCAPADATPEQRRDADSLLIAKAIDWDHRGVRMEILTTDPHAEGAYIRVYITGAARNPHTGEGAADARRLLELHGGCSSACRMSNVDPEGDVRACRFRGHAALGNVRVRKFSDIWRESNSSARQLLPLST